MALEGTIRDFGLGDIFQLIGIQRKTGELQFDSGSEQVTVKFLDGSVVGAESHNHNLENLLGSVLVRTGMIAQSQLDEALRIQKGTLQRLGHILVDSGFISAEDLQSALRTQVTQIVYRLFRWRAGTYRFSPVENMEYDKNFTPVSAETILMEGARMVDEWPILERKIRSEKMVFAKTEAAMTLQAPVESIVDAADIDMEAVFSGEDAAPAETGSNELTLTGEEQDILRMIDGTSAVRDVVDHSAFGEFDTYRILHELLTRNLIEEVESDEADGREVVSGFQMKIWTVASVLVAGIALGAMSMLAANPITPWKLFLNRDSITPLRTYASRERVQLIERALQVCFLDTGSMPTSLESLADNHYLEPKDLLDPWGRRYGYALGDDRYSLIVLDAEGLQNEQLTIVRPFSPAMQQILKGVQ
jgi:hypothetical protein